MAWSFSQPWDFTVRIHWHCRTLFSQGSRLAINLIGHFGHWLNPNFGFRHPGLPSTNRLFDSGAGRGMLLRRPVLSDLNSSPAPRGAEQGEAVKIG